MKLNINIRKEYDSIKKDIFINNLDEIKNDEYYNISESKETFTEYLNKLVEYSRYSAGEVLDTKLKFILENVRLVKHKSGDPLYKYSDTKIFVPIEEVSNEEKLLKIIGSVVFYIVGTRYSLQRKQELTAIVSQQLATLIAKVGYRPSSTEGLLEQIERYTLVILNINHGKNLETSLYKDMRSIDIQYPTDVKQKDFLRYVERWNTEIYFEEVAKLLGLTSPSFKQVFASRYGINAVMAIEDISNYFLILFLSDIFKIKEVISSYILSNDVTSANGQRIIDSILYKFNTQT